MASNPAMNPWTPTKDPRTLRRTGKLLEELGELIGVVARIQIQGIDEIDPSSGKTNRQRLIEESADVLAQVELAIAHFGLDTDAIRFRVSEKKRQMAEWEPFFPAASAHPKQTHWTPSPEQFEAWCERHDMNPTRSQEAFDDAVSLHLDTESQIPKGGA